MDEALRKIKDLIYAKVEYDVANTDDAWLSNRLLPLYLQLKTLDKMDEMLESLDEVWKKLDSVQDEVGKLNPLYS